MKEAPENFLDGENKWSLLASAFLIILVCNVDQTHAPGPGKYAIPLIPLHPH